MITEFFSGEYGTRVINTGLSILAILTCICIGYWLFKGHFNSKRKQNQFRSRMAYLGILIFILVLTRIWVTGFTHLFTMLSLVAAGLVVTNKETIMNFSGWLIINWRGVFAEGDYIHIQNFTGCIDSIRMFHFKIYESLGVDGGKPTGRIIKVPNSLIITTPFVLFTADKNFLLKTITFPVSTDSNPLDCLSKMADFVKKLWEIQYISSNAFSKKFLLKKNGRTENIIQFDPRVEINIIPDKEKMATINIYIYCSLIDASHFEQKISEKIIHLYKNSPGS